MASVVRFLLLSALTLTSCGGEGPAPLSNASGKAANPGTEPCEIGLERRCQETIEQSSGVHSCFWGTQVCGAEGWGPCENGRTFEVPKLPPGREALSQSGAPISCANTCDPSCQHWLEPGGQSGGLDLSLPDFPGTAGGGSTCAHELCSTGAALTSSCDPCVAQVCALDPTCCGASGGTWDDLCVDAVFQTCLSTPRPYGLCDFGIFSTSASQVTINSLVTSSEITVGGYGNITLSGSSGKSVRRILTAGPAYLGNQEFPPLGIVAEGDITLNSSSSNVPIGPLESGQSVNMYNRPLVNGDVYSRGNVVWQTNVYGDVVAGGSISLDGGCSGAVFGGTCTAGSGHPAPSLSLPTEPVQTFSCGGTDQNVGSGNLSLDPGNYGNLYVGGELTLNGPGTYNFNTLYARDLRILGTSGLTEIEVCNEFNVMSNGRVLNSSGTILTDPSLLFVSVKGNLHFDNNVEWVGVVLAGSSGTKSGGSIHGAIWASPVNDLNSQTSIVGISSDACRDMGIDGTIPPACPIAASSPGVPAAIVEPCSIGNDCQLNRSCREPVTGASCAHSKCAEGSPLDASCDPCVAAICAADPDCCSVSWTAACVSKVAHVCDAVCGADAGLCNAPVCSEPGDGTSVCDFTVSAAGSVNISSPSSLGLRPQVSGGVGTAGALSLNWADVSGELFVGGAFSSVSATHGTLTPSAPAVFVPVSASCPATDGAPSSGSVGPGDYGMVVVGAGDTLTLEPGTYTFQSLVLSDASGPSLARLELPPAGAVQIYVCQTPTSVVFGTGAEVIGLTASDSLRLSLQAEGEILVRPGASTAGFFQSDAGITFTDAEHRGLLTSGSTVNLIGGSVVDGSGLRAECLLSGHDPAEDPALLGAPSESGACVENAPGYEDATCSGYDLALGIPCSDQIPVCNHGTAAYTGALSVGVYDSLSPNMASVTPPGPTSTCTASVNLAPGTCENITCSSLPSGVLTLMLDPTHLLDECGSEERRRDNWTVHDQRICGGDSMYEYEYLATCSERGTVPLFGLLTYSASIPFGSTIQFLGRVGKGDSPAEAAADAEAKPFTDLITADHSLANCHVGGPLPCPLDVPEVLGLSGYAGQHLDLRIVLSGASGQNPTLEDYRLSYSCVYDQ